MSLLRPIRILLLGAPGSGKGTQTSRLIKDFTQLSAISSGDLLRQNIKDGTPIGKSEINTTVLNAYTNTSSTGKEAESIIKDGGLIPDDKIVSLIKTELVGRNWLNNKSSWLLDGFPRTSGQAQKLDATLTEHDAALNLVVELDVPEEVILDRIENRFVVSRTWTTNPGSIDVNANKMVDI